MQAEYETVLSDESKIILTSEKARKRQLDADRQAKLRVKKRHKKVYMTKKFLTIETKLESVIES